jgi:antitoxin CptB
MDEATQRGRLAWRCRRGMKELDLLLLEFLEQHWPHATSGERDAFAALLELPDPTLAAYLLGHAPCPDSTLEPLLCLLRGLAARRAGRRAHGGEPPATLQS